MESKVSRRLKEPLASQILEHIYAPRLARDFAKQFDYLTEVNQAHLLMLQKSGLIETDIARQIASGLQQMEVEGPSAVELDPAKEDPYFNYEAKLMSITGRDIGGRLHMARSRNDIAATIDRIRARVVVLQTVRAIARVRSVALDAAVRHAETVMPGFTHLQPAQPISFGFYLSAVADAMGRDMDRLLASLPHIDALPLGAGALAGTRFAIDREISARYLGFNTVMPNTLDSVASRDFALEAMSAMAINAVTWGRVAQDLHVWSTPQFGLLTFPDSVASTSSIMPQKKNPAVLEYLKGKSAHIIGLMNTALVTVKGTFFTHAGDSSRESMRNFWECAEEIQRSLSLFELIVSSVQPNIKRMSEHVRFDFSVATDLADGLVADADISFRDAHHVVGELVRLALDADLSAAELTSAMLDQAAEEVMGRSIGWPDEKLAAYLDPIASLHARSQGGPAPASVLRHVAAQRAHIEAALELAQVTQDRIDAAHALLKRDAKALAAR